MMISQAMHVGAHCVPPEAPVGEIARLMRAEDIGAVPVCEDGHPIGMITDRDLTVRALALGDDAHGLKARDVMSGPAIFCRTDGTLEDAVRLMESRQIRRLPVVDEAGTIAGILSLGDICHGGSRDLAAEAIVATTAHHPDQLVLIQS